jgi:hypothetical protein
VSIFPELPLAHIWQDAGTSARGRKLKALEGRPRIDLAIYAQREKPIAVVELKRWASFSSFDRDIVRIQAVLRKTGKSASGPLRYGIVAGVRPVTTRMKKESSVVGEEIRQKAASKYGGFEFDFLLRHRNLPKPLKYDRTSITGFDAFAFVVSEID